MKIRLPRKKKKAWKKIEVVEFTYTPIERIIGRSTYYHLWLGTRRFELKHQQP